MKIDRDEINKRVVSGLINMRKHPHLDLYLYNYSPKCTYDNLWDDYTKMCRGLITDVEGNVLALPFPKFFNHGDPKGFEPLPDDRAEITLKYDGSLGISYPIGNGKTRWATRGTFTSEQAEVANDIWINKYPNVSVPDGYTLLCEIIHPLTRVVVQYDFYDLVILGARNYHTGEYMPYDELVKWCIKNKLKITPRFFGTVNDCLNLVLSFDSQEEGFVLDYHGQRVKVKGPEYVAIHRLLQGFSPRRMADIWYHERSDMVLHAPDEVFDDLTKELRSLDIESRLLERKVISIYNNIKDLDNKRQAKWLKEKYPKYLGLVMRLCRGNKLDYKLFVYKKKHGGNPRPITDNKL